MAEKERKLTKAEARRVENFAVLSERLQSEGYKVTKCDVSAAKVNIYTLVLFIPFGIVYWLLFRLTGTPLINIEVIDYFDNVAVLIAVAIGIYVVSSAIMIVVHEALHGLTWALFCKNRFQSIQFGIIPRNLMAYCTCLEPLDFKAYLVGAMMPLVVLGFGVFAVSLITGSLYWFLFANFATLGAGGDMSIVLMLLGHRQALLLDHPTEPGFYAFEKTT